MNKLLINLITALVMSVVLAGQAKADCFPLSVIFGASEAVTFCNTSCGITNCFFDTSGGSDLFSDSSCNNICIPPVCGDGILSGAEQCDDGNNNNGDGCDGDCQIEAVCGNGTIENGEECDDGNIIPGDGCSDTCTSEAVCGNAIVEGSEECDDGNNNNGDGCDDDCEIEVPSSCLSAQLVFGNETTNTCMVTCGVPSCYFDPAISGVIYEDDSCTTPCTAPTSTCGNGIIEGAEQCDDGNNNPGDGCDPICVLEPICGNNILEGGEQCDDGNAAAGDGCSSTCQIEQIEECLEMELVFGSEAEDICTNACGIADCYFNNNNNLIFFNDTCTVGCGFSTCGNGVIETGEDCDDGNTTDGDGCSSVCANEAGTNPVLPILECVLNRGSGSYTVFLSYHNQNNEIVSIPDGPNNFISYQGSINPSLGQQTIFQIGQPPPYPNADVSIDTDGTDLVWSVTGPDGQTNTVTANANSQACPAICGNSVIEAGEQCDDGNTIDNDGCSSSCQQEAACAGTQIMYAIHDEGSNDSFAFSFNTNTQVISNINNEDDEDIEASDLHPTTDLWYAFSNERLKIIDKTTGIPSSGGFQLDTPNDSEVQGASFNTATNQLWGAGDGGIFLRIFDITDGSSTLIESSFPVNSDPEAIAWQPGGDKLVMAFENNSIYIYAPATQTYTLACPNLGPGVTNMESMEYDLEGNLVVSVGGSSNEFGIDTYDLDNCQRENNPIYSNITTSLDDTETLTFSCENTTGGGGGSGPVFTAVEPLLECVEETGLGRRNKYRAHFSYNNTNNTTFNQAAGPNNGVKYKRNSDLNVGQPEVFNTGLNNSVFSVLFDGSKLEWKLRGPDNVERKVTADKNSPECNNQQPVCATIDFNNLIAGTIVNSQFNSIDVTVTAQNNNPSHPDQAIVFDSSNPSGGDSDLGTPNSLFGGPGQGSSGSNNDSALEEILIIAEDIVDANSDNLVDDPDDEAAGGKIIFTFDEEVQIESLDVIDNESNNSSAVGFDEETGGDETFNVQINSAGNNSVQTININQTDFETERLEVTLGGSAAIDNLTFCAEDDDDELSRVLQSESAACSENSQFVVLNFKEITYFNNNDVIASSNPRIRLDNGGLGGTFNPSVWPFDINASNGSGSTRSRGTLFRVYGFNPSLVGTFVNNADNEDLKYQIVEDKDIPGAFYINLGGPARVEIKLSDLQTKSLDLVSNIQTFSTDGSNNLDTAQLNVPGVMLSLNKEELRIPKFIRKRLKKLGTPLRNSNGNSTKQGSMNSLVVLVPGSGSDAFREFVDIEVEFPCGNLDANLFGLKSVLESDKTNVANSCAYLDDNPIQNSLRFKDKFTRRKLRTNANLACGDAESKDNQILRTNFDIGKNSIQILSTVSAQSDIFKLLFGDISGAD